MNGDRESRLETLKGMIMDLHAGGAPEALKARFKRLLAEVDALEIARLEQRLIEDGLPVEEVKRLCDVHVRVFQDSLDKRGTPDVPPGHPVHTLLRENRTAEGIAARIEEILRQGGNEESLRERGGDLQELLAELGQMNRHYLRKENQLFPQLEARGLSGTTKIMWAVHDDIRALLKKAKAEAAAADSAGAVPVVRELLRMMRDMIYKEEHVLFPTSLQILTGADWARVRRGGEENGYAWIQPAEEADLTAAGDVGTQAQPETSGGGGIALAVGLLTPEQIDLILTHLPVDLSFIDERDEVAYYSGTADRIFPRSPAVIGRKVRDCHPPKSVPVVQRILDSFKAGERNEAAFHIQLGARFVQIRYFAVRDAQGRYRGTLEVSQDVTGIRALTGEKRLLDWK